MRSRYFVLLLIFLFTSCEKNQNDTYMLKVYGDALEDIGYSIARSNEGYVIAGQISKITRNSNSITGSSKRLGIIKTDPDGNLLWKNSFGGPLTATGSKVLALEDNSVICIGYVVDSVTLEKDIFIVKTGSGDTSATEKIFKNPGNQYCNDIIKTTEGFLVLGTTDIERQPLTDSTGNTAGKKDILLLRFDNNLELISSSALGFPKNDEGVAIKNDPDGGYIILGTTERSPLKAQQALNNILILKVNTEGSATELKILGGNDDEYAADMEVLNDGYLIAGTVIMGTEQRGYVWKLTHNIQTAPVNPHVIEIGVSFSVKAISKYKTNSFVMAGQSGAGSSAKMLIFVTDGEGNPVEGKKMIVGGTGIQAANDVISDTNDNIIAVGKNSYENNSMISLIKFRF